MKIDAVPFGALTRSEIEHWAELHAGTPELHSPFFHPGYTGAVATVQPGVRIGRLTDRGRTVGYFPFQFTGRHRGGPVGGKRSNYQGVIAEPGAVWDVASLLRGCGLHLFQFDHLLAGQSEFAAAFATTRPSPRLDLSGGFDAYEQSRVAAGSHVVTKTRQQSRRLERDHGPLHFEAHVADHDMMRRFMRWKSDQYVRTGGADKFAVPSVAAMLTDLHRTQTTSFAGVLSVLSAGDRPVAAHFGLRSQTDWHYWFPAYDPEFATGSPGLVLLLEMARAAESLGIAVIDLGRGVEPYKTRFATSEVSVAAGTATVPSLTAGQRQVRRALGNARRSLRETRIGAARSSGQ